MNRHWRAQMHQNQVWQERGGDPVGLMEVLDGVGFEVVKGWLAVLLGGFELKQDGGFYDKEGVVVRLGYTDLRSGFPQGF